MYSRPVDARCPVRYPYSIIRVHVTLTLHLMRDAHASERVCTSVSARSADNVIGTCSNAANAMKSCSYMYGYRYEYSRHDVVVAPLPYVPVGFIV